MVKRPPLNYSGIFYDSANLVDFKKWFEARILGGATTNPLILQKDGVLDLPKHISQMIKIAGPGFPISIELPDSDMSKPEMISLATKYHKKFPKKLTLHFYKVSAIYEHYFEPVSHPQSQTFPSCS